MQADSLELKILNLINAERAEVGAAPFELKLNVNEAAEVHSEWMLAVDSFSDTGAGNSNPGTGMTNAGFDFNGSYGGNCNDTLQGDGGSDLYTGGAGADTFVFNQASGNDTVLDFGHSDTIRISSGADDMSDLTFTDTSEGLLVEFGAVDIFFDGLDRSELNASDFDFV